MKAAIALNFVYIQYNTDTQSNNKNILLILIGMHHKKRIIVLFMIQTVTLIIVVYFLSHAAEFTDVSTKKRSATHTTSFTFGTRAITTRYRMYDGFWNIYVWNHNSIRDNKKHMLSGGIRNPYLIMGAYRDNGAHRIFNDISGIDAWSSIPRQLFTWTLASPTYTPNIGVRVSYDPVALWTSKDTDKETLGAALGYKFSFWEPRIIYQHSNRANLPLDETVWNSWQLDRPPAMHIHQMGTSQKFFLGKHIRINGTIVASTTDVTSPYMAGYGILSFLSTYIDIRLKGGGSDKKYVNTAWRYSKYLWDQSTEIKIKYAPYSYIRYRHSIAEYNPFHIERTKTMLLDQYYEATWQHLFLLNEGKGNQYQKHSMQPKLTYKRNIDAYLHQIETEYIWRYQTWKLQGTVKQYLYEHKEHGTINAHKHSLRIKGEYRVPSYALTLSAQIKALTVKMNTDATLLKMEDIIKTWKVSTGYRMRIGKLILSAGQHYIVNKHDNRTHNLSLEIDFTIRYTIR